jgi:hypothetical protein
LVRNVQRAVAGGAVAGGALASGREVGLAGREADRLTG